MYETDLRVGLDDVSPDCNMTTDAMLRFMTNSATYHAQDRVYDIEEMVAKRRGWFVITWQVRIKRSPKLCERIKIQTFPYGFRGFIAMRHFKILSEAGEVLVTANSMWTFMDLENVKPVRIPEDFLDLFGQDEGPDEEWPGRKLSVPEAMEEQYRFTVSPMFLDTNGHMNNSYYVQAAGRCLPEGVQPESFFVE